MGRTERLQRDGLTARALKHVCQLAATHRTKETVQPQNSYGTLLNIYTTNLSNGPKLPSTYNDA